MAILGLGSNSEYFGGLELWGLGSGWWVEVAAPFLFFGVEFGF